MANFGDILSSLSVGAGQSIRRNAGDSAFEAYTPGAGLTVGSAVTGGVANGVLCEDGSQNLAASAELTFNGSDLTVGGGTAAKAILIGDTDASDGVWLRNDGNNMVFSSKVGHMYFGYGGRVGMSQLFYAGNPNRLVFTVEDGFLTLAADAALKGSKTSGGVFLDVTNGVDANCRFIMSVPSSGDPNMQIGSSVSNRISFAPNGVEAGSAYPNGAFGIGTAATSPSAKLHVISTTEQLRAGYDASNRMSLTVGSTGGVTFDAVGSGAKFTFSDDVELSDAKNLIVGTTTGTKIGSGSTQKLGFWGVTPVAQQASIVALTDGTSGAAGNDIGDPDLGAGLMDATIINDNFKRILDRINLINTRFQTTGFTA